MLSARTSDHMANSGSIQESSSSRTTCSGVTEMEDGATADSRHNNRAAQVDTTCSAINATLTAESTRP